MALAKALLLLLLPKQSGIIKTWVIRNKRACSILEYSSSNHLFFNTVIVNNSSWFEKN